MKQREPRTAMAARSRTLAFLRRLFALATLQALVLLPAAASTPEEKLTAPRPSASDEFGGAMAIDAATLVVSEHRNDDLGAAAGAVYVYEKDLGGDGNWALVRQIYASDAHHDDKFGISVALSGDTLVVGSFLDDDGGRDSGSVYVYERDAGGQDNWGEVAKLTASLPSAVDRFGISVALDGATLVVGADKYDGTASDAGAAYVFERDADTGSWAEVSLLTASDRRGYDKFGVAVAVHGDTLVVGANQENNSGGSDAGAVYVFKRGVEGIGNWDEVVKLTATDGDKDFRFGTSVAIFDATLVVGGDEQDEGAGSVYISSATKRQTLGTR
jgi:hypothetical protein